MSVSLYPASFDAALFDFDGTLAITKDIWSEIDRAFLGARGIEMPSDYPKTVNLLGFEAGAAYTIERFGLKDSIEDIKRAWAEHAEDLYQKRCVLREGVSDYIGYLKENGVSVALVTTGSPDTLQSMQHIAIDELFDVQVYVHEVGRSKKHPDIYLEAAKRLHIDVSKCMVFEDILPGIKTAHSAGFLTCGVNNLDPEQDKEEIQLLCDVWIDDWNIVKA